MRTKKDRITVKATISLDERNWMESEKVLSEIGLSRSAFINITLGQLLREYRGIDTSKGGFFGGDMVGTVFKHARDKGQNK